MLECGYHCTDTVNVKFTLGGNLHFVDFLLSTECFVVMESELGSDHSDVDPYKPHTEEMLQFLSGTVPKILS
jgi:hypothetical protein